MCMYFFDNAAHYMQIAQNAISFSTHQKIKVWYGAKFSRTSSFVLQSYAILVSICLEYVNLYICQQFSNSVTIFLGNHAIVVLRGNEDYYTTSTAFAAIFQEINGHQQLGFIVVSGKNYNVEL